MFITFEGVEGCGKSTHIKLAAQYLKEKGISVVLTREPGATEIGHDIRQVLLHSSAKLQTLSELLLFEVDRAENVGQIILPALKSGKIVLCDRFTDSTLAYQIAGRGLAEDMVRYFNMVSSQGLIPDLTVLLDLDPKVGLERAATKGAADKFEKEQLQFHLRVRNKFLELAKNEPNRFVIIKSQDKIEKVQEQIRKSLDEKLSNKR